MSDNYRDGLVGFGKYKNKRLRELPDDYLKWLIKQKNCEGRFWGEYTIRKKEKLSRDGKKVLKEDRRKFYERKIQNSNLRATNRMSFGKYRGVLISEIPDSYLEWVLKLGSRNTDAKYLMDEYIYRLELKKNKLDSDGSES